MPTLHELQSGFVDFIVGEKADDLVGAIEPNGIDPVRLLSIYRNNALITLTETLAAVYPVVRRLVDPRFFDYAASTFIASNLPSQPCLSEYGSEFPAFLALFPPASGLPYLSDVAGLEWAINRVMRSKPEASIGLSAITGKCEDAAEFRLRFEAGVRYVGSKYPIRKIWLENSSDTEPTEIQLTEAAEHLQVRLNGGLEITPLPAASWLFRARIADRAALGAATEAAFELDSLFDLPNELAKVFGEGLIVGVED
jgi:Putative DNA-binding domain